MKTPPYFAEEVNRMMFDFVWNHKPAKIKKANENALKLNWVINRLSLDHGDDASWRYISTSLLANGGGAFLFQCNYDCKLLCLSEHLPRIYKDVITYWQKIVAT